MGKKKFLGLDLSTQSLTAMVVDVVNGGMYRTAVDFDQAFPSHGTRGGVLLGADPRVVHGDPRVWLKALDEVFGRLKAEGLAGEIGAMAISAQQHGTVYLNAMAESRFRTLDSARSLAEQLTDIFSRPTAPVWMDSSTQAECLEIAGALGGDLAVAALTGSRATERFAGPQIRKFWKENPAAYEETAHIALISSFATSLLLGRFAPLDGGDGFGTNLADIRTGSWSKNALEAAAPGLRQKLPDLVCGDRVAGRISPYFVRRYGLCPDTGVVAGTGDNPSSLVGLGLVGDDRRKAISLGTSDTCFGYMSGLEALRSPHGHIFGAADGRYMFLLCFKNGSLAREEIRNRYRLSWNGFSEILLSSAPGNGGKIMLPWFAPEITPRVPEPRVYRFGGLAQEDTAGNVRAVAEAQVMAMFLHGRGFGKKPDEILVTAGASENRGLLQVIADVFQVEVRSFAVRDSAALGAAIRAARDFLKQKGDSRTWRELAERFIGAGEAVVVSPGREAAEIYHGENGLLALYEECERFALEKRGTPPLPYDCPADPVTMNSL